MDFYSATNIIISATTGAALIGGLVVQLALQNPPWDSFVWSFRFALGIFLAWALGREIDPEYDLSALIAAGLAIPGMIIFGVPLILGGLWLLLVLRMVVRTAGPKPGAADGAIITALALWLVHRYSWFYGCTAVLFFLFDALFAPRNKSSFLFAGVSAVGTAVVTLLLGDYAGSFAVSKAMGFLILGVIAAVLFLVLTEGRTQTRSDDGSHPLNRARLRAAQIGSLVLVVLLLYRTGLTGFTDTIPLLAAVSGAVLYRPIGLIRRRRG